MFCCDFTTFFFFTPLESIFRCVILGLFFILLLSNFRVGSNVWENNKWKEKKSNLWISKYAFPRTSAPMLALLGTVIASCLDLQYSQAEWSQARAVFLEIPRDGSCVPPTLSCTQPDFLMDCVWWANVNSWGMSMWMMRLCYTVTLV